jgi:hypothetical protein
MQPLVPVPAPPVLPAHMVPPPAAAVPAPTRPSRPITAQPEEVVELTPPPLPEPPLTVQPPPRPQTPLPGVVSAPMTPAAGDSMRMPAGWNTGEVPTFAAEYAPDQRRPWALVGGVSTGTLFLGILLGYMIWGGKSAPVPAPEPAAMPVAAAAVPPAAASAPVESAGVPAAAPAPPGCTATITSEPAGAKVSIGGKALGVTPLANVSLPCTGTLIFDRVRYARVEKPVALTAGQPGNLSAQLARAEAMLNIVSTPPGASVTVNGQAAGKAPVQVKVPAFTKAAVSVSLNGYKPWAQKIYVKGKKQPVAARLEPLAKSKAPARPTARKPGAR